MHFPSHKKKRDSLPVHIETSGVDCISGSPNWITLSPKRHAPPRIEVLKACQELKVIIYNKNDIIFAEDMAKKTRKFNPPLLFIFAHPLSKVSVTAIGFLSPTTFMFSVILGGGGNT